MQKASKDWQKTRRATLERAHGAAIEPLNFLYLLHFAVCALYLAGFIRFRFFEYPPDFTWVTALGLLIVGTSGVLVPILTASVLTLHFTSKKLNALLNDHRNEVQTVYN